MAPRDKSTTQKSGEEAACEVLVKLADCVDPVEFTNGIAKFEQTYRKEVITQRPFELFRGGSAAHSLGKRGRNSGSTNRFQKRIFSKEKLISVVGDERSSVVGFKADGSPGQGRRNGGARLRDDYGRAAFDRQGLDHERRSDPRRFLFENGKGFGGSELRF